MIKSATIKRSTIIPFDPEFRLAVEHMRIVSSEKTGIIFWHNDAKDQMLRRGILLKDALRILEYGNPIFSYHGRQKNEFKIAMALKPKGMREVVVITATIKLKTGIVLVTNIMWRNEYVAN